MNSNALFSSGFTDGKLVMTLDFKESLFQHCVLLVQDVSALVEKNYLQNVEIYIGNSTDYKKNPKCAGGPF